MSPGDAALIAAVRSALKAAADPAAAEPMRAYMKSAQPFLGVPKPARVRALQPVFREHPLPDRERWEATVRGLWDEATYREERYAATQLAQAKRYARWALHPSALPLYDHMIVTGAWWDHVDDVAIRSVGPVLREHREVVTPLVRRWCRDPDRWRRRASIICQIGAKDAVDVDLLAECVLANADDSDFFLRKGIGWALRQFARSDPDWVRAFVDHHADRLSALSRREALRNLSRTG